MSKAPAFQFYPGDWITDSVSGCSLAAQGLWLRLMCLMHGSERYGFLVVNGQPMPDAMVARRIGCAVEEYRELLAELESAGVPSRSETGVIYSRRMVRDAEDRRTNSDRQRRFYARHNGQNGQSSADFNDSPNGNSNGQPNGNLTPGLTAVSHASSSSPPSGGEERARPRGAAERVFLKTENKSPPPLEAVAAEVRGYVDGFRSTGKQPTGWKSAFGAAVATVFSPGIRALSGMNDSEFSIAIQNAYEQALAENKAPKTA